jgi:hypothetical protein
VLLDNLPVSPFEEVDVLGCFCEHRSLYSREYFVSS